MAVWGNLELISMEQLNQLIDIDSKLKNWGYNGLDNDMMTEVRFEISKRIESLGETIKVAPVVPVSTHNGIDYRL